MYAGKNYEGQVISQSIAEGKWVDKGTTVTITVSLGKKIERVQMINVVGMSQNSAQNAISQLGLLYNISTAYSDTVPAGQVISQSVDEGEWVDKGTTVTITISLGKDPSTANTGNENTDNGNTGNEGTGTGTGE